MHTVKFTDLKKEDNRFVRIASCQTMLNRLSTSSFISNKYSKLESKVIGGLGKIYLAPDQKVVVLSPEAMLNTKRFNILVEDILECVNRQYDSIILLLKERRKEEQSQTVVPLQCNSHGFAFKSFQADNKYNQKLLPIPEEVTVAEAVEEDYHSY